MFCLQQFSVHVFKLDVSSVKLDPLVISPVTSGLFEKGSLTCYFQHPLYLLLKENYAIHQ